MLLRDRVKSCCSRLLPDPLVKATSGASSNISPSRPDTLTPVWNATRHTNLTATALEASLRIDDAFGGSDGFADQALRRSTMCECCGTPTRAADTHAGSGA